MATKRKQPEHPGHESCTHRMKSVKDALEALSGKWKLPILISLAAGPRRFKEMAKEINGITDRMLSKELKELEVNQLVTRTVYDSFPPVVEYSITEHGKTIKPAIDALHKWGVLHRQKIMGKKTAPARPH